MRTIGQTSIKIKPFPRGFRGAFASRSLHGSATQPASACGVHQTGLAPSLRAAFASRSLGGLAAQVATACGSRSSRLAPGCRRAFTLVEMLVVMGIIVVLAGLVAVWAVGARKSYKRHATQSAMGNLLLVTEVVKTASPIAPDHRLANFFWVQPHDTVNTPPRWSGANMRQMSSGEYLVFIASLCPSADKMVASLGGDFLRPSPVVPGGKWDVNSVGAAAPLVDVFEQDPQNVFATAKNPSTQVYSLVSPLAGYSLRAPVDAWGFPLIFRLATDRGDLNQTDSESAVQYDNAGNANGTYKIREKIVMDEQLTRDCYAAAGLGPVSGTEYVRPAVPALGSAFFMSPGPDGVWGAFSALAPGGSGSDYARDAMADPGSSRDADAKDNLYSQEASR